MQEEIAPKNAIALAHSGHDCGSVAAAVIKLDCV
jgi:hypothetical protein